MGWTIAGVVLAVVVVAGGLVYWRARRRKQSRLISFVALLKEPMTFDPAVLASVAGRAWNADLGTGETEGADGFVACAGPLNTIIHDDRMFLINCFSTPYVENVAEVAEQIPDLRIRALFAEHAAWFSCDAMGVDGTTPDEEVREWYRRLGKLFVELFDENCLLIFLPDTNSAYPINEETEAALRSDDPLTALEETMTVPVIEVSTDDPLMQQAIAKARAEWPKFVAAYESRAGENFAVKAPVTHADTTEFIWLEVTALEGDRIYGKLANDPANLGPLKLGSKLAVPVAEINDWCYAGKDGNLAGAFTVEAVAKAATRKK